MSNNGAVAKAEDNSPSSSNSGVRCGSESESAATERGRCGRSGSGYQLNATTSVRSWRDVPKEQRQRLLFENQLQISSFSKRTTRRIVSESAHRHCKLMKCSESGQ